MKEWNSQTRADEIRAIDGQEFDIVIIGGGITGAGIAREAALRGLKFCLLEKKDFASGTSSRSSKLFHGGFRYLKQGRVGRLLTRESTTERNWLAAAIPNLVRPLAFLCSAYEKSKDSPAMLRKFIFLYTVLSDWFSKYKTYRKARVLSPKQIAEWEPELAQENAYLGKIKMGGLFYDTNCDDSRMTLESIKDALSRQPDSRALSYCEALSVSGTNMKSVLCMDEFSSSKFHIRSQAVVSATGIWTDQFLNRNNIDSNKIFTSKGVHLSVPAERIGNRAAHAFSHIDDNRFVFVLRRGNLSTIGTTDTAYPKDDKSLEEPFCKKEDADYLLRIINVMFPHARIRYQDILGTWAGVRPLVRSASAKSESDISRTHEIFDAGGITVIVGGKSTTYRLMAEDLIFHLAKKGVLAKFSHPEHRKRSFSKKHIFKFACTRKYFDKELQRLGLENICSPEQQAHLWQQYGKASLAILQRVLADEESGRAIIAGQAYSKAEFIHIIHHEIPLHLTDILIRRTEAQWSVAWRDQRQLAELVAQLMGAAHHWDESRRRAEVKDYLTYVYNSVSFIPGAKALLQ